MRMVWAKALRMLHEASAHARWDVLCAEQCCEKYAVLGAVALLSGVLAVQLSRERELMLREAKASKARRLRYKHSSKEVDCPVLLDSHYHTFRRRVRIGSATAALGLPRGRRRSVLNRNALRDNKWEIAKPFFRRRWVLGEQ